MRHENELAHSTSFLLMSFNFDQFIFYNKKDLVKILTELQPAIQSLDKKNDKVSKNFNEYVSKVFNELKIT
jgi:hypothetical protein